MKDRRLDIDLVVLTAGPTGHTKGSPWWMRKVERARAASARCCAGGRNENGKGIKLVDAEKNE
jgi:hypothetical protein